MQTTYFSNVVFAILFTSISYDVPGQKMDDYRYDNGQEQPIENAVSNEVQFNGYTNYWHDTYSEWYRYGNLLDGNTGCSEDHNAKQGGYCRRHGNPRVDYAGRTLSMISRHYNLFHYIDFKL